MAEKSNVYVRCQFSKGGFPSERVFLFSTPRTFGTGIAPAEYCYTEDKQRLVPEPKRGERLPGYLAGVKLGEAEPGLVRVYLPNGEVYEIESRIVSATEGGAHVPVKS